MKVALVPCADTEWRESGRLLGRVELSPTPSGRTRCEAWAPQLREIGVSRILHSEDELASQTAAILAKVLGVPRQAVKGLEEADMGLWTGLTEEQLRSRFASAHRELCEAPLNVTPPNGESLSAAQQRIRAALRKRLRKTSVAPVAIVLRPFALALARSVLAGTEPGCDTMESAFAASEPMIIELGGAATDARG